MEGLILARPTKHLPDGLKPGYWYWLDPNSPKIAEALKHGHLVLDDTVQPIPLPLPDLLDEPIVGVPVVPMVVDGQTIGTIFPNDDPPEQEDA